jgi:hypothetical protein
VSCAIDYTWLTGREYRLRVSRLGGDQAGETWAGIVQDTFTGTQIQVGAIHLANSAGLNGYGWLQASGRTSLAATGGPPGCEGHPYARVRWWGLFANSFEQIAERAVVSPYPNCIRNDVTSAGRPYVRQAIGGAALLTTPAGTVLWSTR